MSTSTNSGDLATTSAPATITHPVYQVWAPIWRKLAHVREGVGGFLDGTYLIPHPREWQDYEAASPSKPTKKLLTRRALASYENFASTLIESKKSALFRSKPTRRVGDGKDPHREPSDLERWWANVDGLGTSMDDFIAQVWDPAATFGHVVLYMDRPATGTTLTLADAKMPFLRAYTPLDVPDWLQNGIGGVTAVKFLEAEARTSLQESMNTNAIQTRIVDGTSWQVIAPSGEIADGGPPTGKHQMGLLPVVVLYARRRALLPLIGQSLIGDPQNHIDLYNLISEVRELLRNQTFSWINVPLGNGPDKMTVEEAKALIGSQMGTGNVLFSGLAASILSADAANVKTYHDELTRKVRQIYREAGVAWEADTRDAEAAGSLKIKREELNTRLASYAAECQLAEMKIAELFYRAYYGADAGMKRFATDEVTIQYPDTFDVTPFDDVLSQAQSAMALGMPTEVLKAIRKQLLVKFLPEATPAQVQELEAAIDAAAPDLSPADRLKARTELLSNAASKFGSGAGADVKPAKPAGDAVPTDKVA